MLKNYLERITGYYLSGNRWWMPLVAGCLYSFALPPLNHETHWSLALFPFLGFIILLPLLAFAVQPSIKRAILHLSLYGFTAALGQYHWLIFDNVEGLWHLVIIGLLLTSVIVGCLYLASGLLFRFSVRFFPKSYVFIFPALWVVIDYCRTLGDLAFPWAFLGYALTPILPLAQLASVTGVWGLTFVIVFGNMLFWQFARNAFYGIENKKNLRFLIIFAAVLLVSGAVGWLRMRSFSLTHKHVATISLLQPDIDQLHLSNGFLDAAFAVCESLIVKAAEDKPDVMVLPESALLCYITHRQNYKAHLASLLRSVRTPLIFGSLDWELPVSDPSNEPKVYNTAFYLDSSALYFKPYHKMKLVPFSEAIPFKGLFPLLSRVNLGEADFCRGTENTVFLFGNGIRSAPFICYESIFPDFVRRRVLNGVNLMVNITNDGWFGKSSGPYHHATMARMRSIENGISLARCANSGISMFVDPVGVLYGHTNLFQKAILTGKIPLSIAPSLYKRFGDWFVAGSGILIVLALAVAALRRRL
jgi:apolipoprotein N-acyltransferase